MNNYYKANRNPNWNYGGMKWRLSRSKIDLFISCKRCFYIDNKFGIARPPTFPFNLNNAVDALFKKEFDIYRTKKIKHPLMKQYGIDAIPFEHKKMDEWRDNFKGITCKHVSTGFTVSGAVDDIWINTADELLVVDYKSTSKDGRIDTLNEDWYIVYKRQMEIYQWLLRENGFKVSNTGYFVYANANKNTKAFNGKLEFEITLIPYIGKTDWINDTLLDIKKYLNSEEIPKADENCDYCKYRETAGKKLMEAYKKIKDSEKQKKLL